MAELPKDQRIDLALAAWYKAQSKKEDYSLQKASREYRVNYSTLSNRVHGAVSKKEASQAMQRLSPGKEDSLYE
jgi:hypothetical protein